MMRRPTLNALILAGSLGFASVLSAEPVAIHAATRGQGLTFSHGGSCYLALPAHVGADGERGQVIGEGAVSGTVTIREPFWEGKFDLAVGTVRGAVAEACSTPSEALTGPPPPVAADGRGELPFITDEGLVQFMPMTITETRYREFDAIFDDPEVEVQQGMSGGFLMRDGRPLGMVLHEVEDGGGDITFMRMEEIGINLGRWLAYRGTDAEQPSEDDVVESADSLPLVLLEVSRPALGPDVMAESMISGETPFIYEPQGPLTMTIAIAGDEAAVLSRVQVRSSGEDAAMPRAITILSSPEAGGGNWDSFDRGHEMGLDGLYDSGPKAPRYARRIQIIVSNAWEDGPVRIDAVQAE